jgi:hypothetical protein
MTLLPRLSPLQLRVLQHLTTRRHAMYACDVAAELGLPFVGVCTIRKLRGFGYIVKTNQGWMVTELGVARAHIVAVTVRRMTP